MAFNNPYFKIDPTPISGGTPLAFFNGGDEMSNQAIIKASGDFLDFNNKYDLKQQMTTSTGVNNNPYFNKPVEEAAKNTGSWGSAINAAVSGIAQGVELNEELNAPREYFEDMKFQTADTEVNGVPSYGGIANIRKDLNAIDVEAATRGMEMKGASQGASIGASVGGAVGTAVPVIGNVVGAIGGAVIGGTAGLIAANSKKGKAAKAAAEALERGQNKLAIGQEKYNTTVEDYYGGVDINRAASQREQNRSQRLYGLNQYRDPFRSII